MRRTSPWTLVVAGVLGIGVGFAVDQALTAAGRATFTPHAMLPVFLVLLGAACLALALPVRRAVRGGAGARPLDPFRTLRIAMLAKASSIVGAAIGGVGAGLSVFVATRPAPPSLGSIAPTLATALAGVVLVAAAMIAERACMIREDDDDEHPRRDGAEPGR